jgi:TrmH family RNA methyltransferase
VAGEDVTPELLAEVSTLAHAPRVLGVYRRDDLPRGTRPVTLALWHVADPGNVGTLIRSADAFGAGIALSPGCADPTGPKALRASMGALFRVPIRKRRAGRNVAPCFGRNSARQVTARTILSRNTSQKRRVP